MPPFRDDVITCFSDHHRFVTALRRIASLGEKNVPKCAQQIAREALNSTSDVAVTEEQAREYVRKERERNANRDKPIPAPRDGFINDYD